MIEIRASYDFANYPAMDDVIHNAVGRVSDFSGTNFNGRDLGWVCSSEIEAAKIKRELQRLGLRVECRERGRGEVMPKTPPTDQGDLSVCQRPVQAESQCRS